MARRPTYFNARTGELKGIESMTLGTPEVSLQDYIVNEVFTRQEEVYDSDRVVATLLKNIDPSYIAPSGGGPAAPAGLDSESLVNFLYNEGYINAFALAVSSDSDNQLLRIEIQNVKNDLDSESVDLRSKIDVINTTLGSTLTSETLAIYLQQEIDQAGLIDSDGAARLFIEYGLLDSDQTLNMINEHYDSDAIIQTVLKGYNPAAAAYDSDLVVATISKKRGSLILDSDQVFNMINEHSNTDALDSDQVYNMSLEYGWNYDSDRVVDTFQKNFQYIINITNNNLGKVDSEFVYTMLDSEEVENMFAEHGLAYQVDLDSESAEIRLLRADVDALVAGTYNDAPVIARLNDLEASVDSESARINLLFTNADSDVIEIGQLRLDADSDSLVIQSLSEQAALDSAKITLILNDLDSDGIHIQALSTSIETIEAVNTIQNSRLNTLEARADSEEIRVSSLQTQVNNLVDDTGFDSDQVVAIINENTSAGASGLDSDNVLTLISENAVSITDSDLKAIADLRNDVDSDSIRIQDIQTQINNLVDDTGFDSDQVVAIINENVTPYDDSVLVARLDSDTTAIQDISSRVTVLEAAVDDTGFDSDQIESMINEHVTPYDDSLLVARLDSDSIKIQTMQGQVDALVAGTYDDAPIVARLDSDSIRIQDLQTQINNLVDDTGFDSDQIESMINEHVTPYDDTNIIARLDSDSVTIQDLQTQINNIDVADLRARLDSDSIIIQAIRTSVDSDYDLFNTKIALFNGLTDSDLTTVSNLRNDIDSDSIRIQDLQTQIDNLVDDTGFNSNQIESIINEQGITNSGIIARLDSDSIKIQIMQGQVDALVAGTYDDSAVVARLDSDTTAIQDISSRVTVLEAAVDDTGFDSDQIESMINEHVTPYDDSGIVARLDSDETIIQSLQTQIDVLVAGTYDDSAVVARLDSDELIVQSLQTQIDFLTARLDSDTTVIQSLQTQLDGFDVADIRARLDSDSIAIQSIRSSVDSDYALFNAKIALFNGLTDSDLTTVSILRNDLDSESFEIRALRSDVDSDSIRIQNIAGQVAALEAGTYDDSALVARLDSDSAVLQELRTNLDDSEFIIERTPLRLNNASFATTSSNQVLDTYDVNEHKTVKYIISANKGTDWQSSECLVNHDGTTAYITEYSVMDSGAGDLYIPDVDVSGGAVRLLVTPQTTNINVSIIRTQIN